MPVRFALPPRGWAAAVRCALGQHKIAADSSPAGLALAVAAAVIGTPGHPHGAAARVPGFTLPALGHPGEHVSLAAYAGRPVVVNFFASWCVPCKKEPPLLARFFRTPRERIVMIGVDVNDAAAAALRFVRTAADATAWGVVALPQTFLTSCPIPPLIALLPSCPALPLMMRLSFRPG